LFFFFFFFFFFPVSFGLLFLVFLLVLLVGRLFTNGG
jgi:hypothetical protein